MKAHDKICIRKDDTAPFGFTRHWIYTTKVQEHDIEYIRKDALLEWAKDWQNELDDSLGASMVHHVLNEVIKKIESL